MIKSPRSVVAKSEVEVTAVDLRRGAMDLLARREHSRQELQLKLGRRFDVEPEIISRVVDQLAREGLQSNQRLAEAYLRYRSNRGQGPLKIKASKTWVLKTSLNKPTPSPFVTIVNGDFPSMVKIGRAHV